MMQEWRSADRDNSWLRRPKHFGEVAERRDRRMPLGKVRAGLGLHIAAANQHNFFLEPRVSGKMDVARHGAQSCDCQTNHTGEANLRPTIPKNGPISRNKGLSTLQRARRLFECASAFR